MKTNQLKPTLTCLFLGALAWPSLHASSVDSQQAVRTQLARFWQVAEAQANEPQAALPKEAVRTQPLLRPLYQPSCHPRVKTVVQAPPLPTVQAEQSVHQRAHKGEFGLSILGGLELFKFDWGEESSSETDALRGNLR